jgi:hypothetical protein
MEISYNLLDFPTLLIRRHVLSVLAFLCYGQYIQYNKLKRIINRLKFIKDKKAGQSSGVDMTRKASGIIQIMSANSKSSEYTPLPTASGTATKGGAVGQSEKTDVGGPEDDVDFFPVILEEMEKINKFFIGYGFASTPQRSMCMTSNSHYLLYRFVANWRSCG